MLALLLALLGGCTDYSIIGVEERVPEIVVHPQHIDFGHLESGHESAAETFLVINTGDEDLAIFAPDLISGNTRYEIDVDENSYLIPGGELIEFTVTYSPETYEINGAFVEIISDDPDERRSIVTIEGAGDAPVMSVDPVEVDYGLISIGCDNEERITITNDGNLPLEITSVTQMVTQPADIVMEYGSLPEPPWNLDPGHSIDFLVSYVPTDTGMDDSIITIVGTDPMTPEVVAEQVGDGDVEKWINQTYIQEEIPILDVLWVVDDSGSMNRFQTNLSSNIGLFVSTFMATGADYHMTVITTSNYYASPVITSSHPDPAGALAADVMVGIHGAGLEKGIEMAAGALNSVSSAGPGSAFWRDEAMLVVIYVSDEPDYSTGGWASYLSFFDSVKPLGQFVPYGVIGDYPGGCTMTSPSGTAQFGAGYWDMIDYYGGDWYSICASDWGVGLQNLANAMSTRRSYELDELDPIVTTIEVTVNGQITTDWEYDEASNSVVFSDGSVPTEGQTISIDYAVWGCDGEE